MTTLIRARLDRWDRESVYRAGVARGRMLAAAEDRDEREPPMAKETLKTMKELAEEEAALAEWADEIEDAGHQEDGEPEVTSEPGEQGIATQDEDEEEPEDEPFVREASEMELKIADEIYLDLQSHATEMAAAQVVEKLLKVVDVHQRVCMPGDWLGGEDPYRESDYLGWIGRILCRACNKLEVSGHSVLFWWKNAKTWTKKGVPIRAIGRSLTSGERFLSDGSTAVVIANFQLFRLMNTQQRVAAIYHALRMLSSEGSVRPPQFSGFFDELELFGVGTFEDDALLIRAVEAGLQTELPWTSRVQTSLFEQAEKTDPDARAAA